MNLEKNKLEIIIQSGLDDLVTGLDQMGLALDNIDKKAKLNGWSAGTVKNMKLMELGKMKKLAHGAVEGAVQGSGVLGDMVKQSGGDYAEKFTWVATGLKGGVCPSCIDLNQQVRTMEEWMMHGLPGNAGTYCGPYCVCELIKSSEAVKNPVIIERGPKGPRGGKGKMTAVYEKTDKPVVKQTQQNVAKEAKPKTTAEISETMAENSKGGTAYAVTDNNRFGSPAMVETYGKFDLHSLDNKRAAHINGLIEEANAKADSMGMPRIRGINGKTGTRYAANMGDGVMGINSETYNVLGVSENTKKYKEYTERTIRQELSTIKRGDVPRLSSSYFITDPKELVDSRFWHEFGHHIHQQKGAKTFGEYMNPPLEKKAGAARRKIKAKAKKGIISMAKVEPTLYSEVSNLEWFAENYTLHKMGRNDLITKEFLEFLTEEGIK